MNALAAASTGWDSPAKGCALQADPAHIKGGSERLVELWASLFIARDGLEGSIPTQF